MPLETRQTFIYRLGNVGEIPTDHVTWSEIVFNPIKIRKLKKESASEILNSN